MVRVLRYPRMFYAVCALTIACALLRDTCISASLDSAARVLLIATAALLAVCLILMSSRFFVDARGVGVGFLLRVRRTGWEDVAALGIVCCNSRRRYIYGMYRQSTDFLNMLHHAPACGPWGFVVPVSRRLLQAMETYCPFELDLSSTPKKRREGRMRLQWHHAVLCALMLFPAVLIAFLTGALMLQAAVKTQRMITVLWLTLGAMGLITAGLTLLRRAGNTLLTCPAFSAEGVCVGTGLYLPWSDVRFGYVHRIGRISGMFMLSQPLEAVRGRGAPPVACLSMPDTRTLLIAYLTYCPHANKGMDI